MNEDHRVKDALQRHITAQAAVIMQLSNNCHTLLSTLQEIEHDLRVAETERDYWKKRAHKVE